MRPALRFPIAWKLALVSIIILLVAMVATAFKTSSIFRQVSGDREKDSNRAQADAKANEVEVTLDSLQKRVAFFGTLLLKAHNDDKAVAKSSGRRDATADRDLLVATFLADADLVSLEVQTREEPTKPIERLVDETYLKRFKLDAGFLKLLDKKRPFSSARAFAGDMLLANRSLEGGAPVFAMAIPLVKGEGGRVTHVAIANIQLQTIQRSFAEQGERIIYLVDGKGDVYAHPDDRLALGKGSLKGSEIVAKASQSEAVKGELGYYNARLKERFISAFSKTRFGLTVISEAPESIVLEPAQKVQRDVYYITGLVVSAALFVIFLFSLTITRPIEKLVLATREIARGNFNLSVARLVTTNDEVGTLALSFDAMLGGLRERDKVKSLFNKFHGSSVTESLLSTEQVNTGGVRKQVLVFFSDIRGFTAMSESASPEQVVSMVNEYFSVMVRVILRNHGIVDKFIGDAIMAIWGAPHSSGDDAYYAVKACLEMREALNELNDARMSRGEPPLLIGMGLHMGEAISGTIGSEERMEFTVIGDTVNMASRIESSTKAFGADLLVSDAVVSKVVGRFLFETAGAARVKGKAQALKLHKVRGYIENGQNRIVRTPYSDYEAEHADKVDVV